jgi:23S rRNA (pseudouridine1915-N3)-methyltransferase
MKIVFVFIGGHKEAWLTDLAQEYEKKLKPFYPTEVIRLKPSKQARASHEQKVAEETKSLLKVISPDDFLIVCDEKGDQPGSVELSKKLVKCIETGRSRLVILIGGAFGIGPEVQKLARWKWSLSNLTFNHHLAQAIVLEQVYRAMTIWKGLPYHNE